MQVTIKPGRMVDGQFVPYEPPGPVTPWWWQVDDDEAVYSGSCPTETEAWCQASVALGWAPPPMVARIEGVTAGLNAIRARAEAAEARAALAEAAGYRRAVDDACAALDAAAKEIVACGSPEWGGYDGGRLDAIREAESDVRKLAPAEPSSGTGGPTSGST
jgi:hypothetical protein